MPISGTNMKSPGALDFVAGFLAVTCPSCGGMFWADDDTVEALSKDPDMPRACGACVLPDNGGALEAPPSFRMPAEGDRVTVLANMDWDGHVSHGGRGVFKGMRKPPALYRSLQGRPRDEHAMIQLDNGPVVWGFEVGWGLSEDMDPVLDDIGNVMKTRHVDVLRMRFVTLHNTGNLGTHSMLGMSPKAGLVEYVDEAVAVAKKFEKHFREAVGNLRG